MPDTTPRSEEAALDYYDDHESPMAPDTANEQAPSPPASELVRQLRGGQQACRDGFRITMGKAADALEEANRQHKADRERIAELEELANDNLNHACREATGGERLQKRVHHLEDALKEIRRYPKGWKERGSIADFIDAALEQSP